VHRLQRAIPFDLQLCDGAGDERRSGSGIGRRRHRPLEILQPIDGPLPERAEISGHAVQSVPFSPFL
jgi:hypothetical protein